MQMVLVFGIILAIFVGILLLPSVYRAFVGVPVRAVRNKLAERAAKEAADSSAAASSSTTTDSAPDMTSAAAAGGLGKAAAADTSGNKPTAVAVSVAPLSDTHKENELVLPTPTWVDRCGELRFLRPLIAARKHVLYAVSTVHHPEGQSRILQVGAPLVMSAPDSHFLLTRQHAAWSVWHSDGRVHPTTCGRGRADVVSTLHVPHAQALASAPLTPAGYCRLRRRAVLGAAGAAAAAVRVNCKP